MKNRPGRPPRSTPPAPGKARSEQQPAEDPLRQTYFPQAMVRKWSFRHRHPPSHAFRKGIAASIRKIPTISREKPSLGKPYPPSLCHRRKTATYRSFRFGVKKVAPYRLAIPKSTSTDWSIMFYNQTPGDIPPHFSHWLNGWLNICVCLLVCKWLLIRELFNGLNKFCNTFFLVIHWHSEFMVFK